MMPHEFALPARPTWAKGDELHRTQPATGDQYRVTSSHTESHRVTMWHNNQEIPRDHFGDTKKYQGTVHICQSLTTYHTSQHITYITTLYGICVAIHLKQQGLPQWFKVIWIRSYHLDNTFTVASHVSGVESLCPNPNMCKFLPEPKHSEAIKGRVRGTTNQGKRSLFPPRKQTPCFHLRSHPLHLGIQINHTLRQERTDRMVFLHSWHSFQEGSSLEGESVLTFISFI